MKVLIIGFGSIGKRHFEILNNFDEIKEICIVTKQTIADVITFQILEEVNDLNTYDYFIISSETVKHYGQLKYICSNVDNKKILVEKPLYNKNHDDINSSNKIFTAYNLRFHPVLQKLSTLLKDEDVYYANIMCGQYLPAWRPEQDYRKSYSAKLEEGGGVLRDLSHELDYLTWLFGDIETIDAISTKISDLEINSDDIFTAIGITDKKVIVNITMDYISKAPIRKLLIHTKNQTIEADVINNNMVLYPKNGNSEKIEIEVVDRNHTYANMHKNIINNKFEMLCSFTNGKKIVSIISNITFKEMPNG